jgi:hypothetical protein
MRKLLNKEWIFAFTVFVLANLASIADGDFFNWKMNTAFLLFIGWVYFNRKIK